MYCGLHILCLHVCLYSEGGLHIDGLGRGIKRNIKMSKQMSKTKHFATLLCKKNKLLKKLNSLPKKQNRVHKLTQEHHNKLKCKIILWIVISVDFMA